MRWLGGQHARAMGLTPESPARPVAARRRVSKRMDALLWLLFIASWRLRLWAWGALHPWSTRGS